MIGIVYINDIGICPYLTKYTDSIENRGMDYEVIMWDRDPPKGRTYLQQNYKVFHWFSREDKHPIFKLKDFFAFKRYLNKLIKEQKYEKLIILTSLTGVILFGTLIKKYNQAYIFDYRDASYEFLPFYKKMIGKLVDASFFTCISSKGFLDILPPTEKYVIAHNFQYADLGKKEAFCQKTRNRAINVNYVGLLRENYLIKMIDVFANDKRFILNFHGGGELLDKAKTYATGLDNITFTGEYRGAEKIQFIKQADLICYNYPSSFINDKALANKYYDAMIFKKPLLGNIKTYSGQLILQNGLGLSLDLDDPLYTQKVYDYYLDFDCEFFNENAEKALAEVLTEDNLYLEKIEAFLMKPNNII